MVCVEYCRMFQVFEVVLDVFMCTQTQNVQNNASQIKPLALHVLFEECSKAACRRHDGNKSLEGKSCDGRKQTAEGMLGTNVRLDYQSL